MGIFALPYSSVLQVDQNTVLGRTSAGTGATELLSASQLRTIVNVEDGATAGATWDVNVTGQPTAMPQAEAETGTATTERTISADVLSAAIAAQASGGSPGGSDTQIQFNDSGAFGGSANLTYDSVAGLLSATSETVLTAPSASSVPVKISLAATPTGNALEINSSLGSGGDLASILPDGSAIFEGVEIRSDGLTETTIIGNGATTSNQTSHTVVGHSAHATNGATSIGATSSASGGGVSIGWDATGGNAAISIGRQVTAGQYTVAIGQYAYTAGTSAVQSAIAIGAGISAVHNLRTEALPGECVIGTNKIYNFYFGGWNADYGSSDITLTTGGRTGTDLDGYDVDLSPGAGTGAGVTSRLTFSAPQTGSTGSTNHTKEVRHLTTENASGPTDGMWRGVTDVAASTYNVLNTDHVITISYTSTGTCAVTLPTATSCWDSTEGVGQIFIFKDLDCNAGSNNITISRSSTDTITSTTTGNTSVAMNTNGQTLRIQAVSASEWAVL